MSVKSLKIVNFEMQLTGVDQEECVVPLLCLGTLSDDRLIELIVKQFPPNRRTVAGRQIRIYFNKIISLPEMRSDYIQKIKQLIIYEKNLNKK